MVISVNDEDHCSHSYWDFIVAGANGNVKKMIVKLETYKLQLLGLGLPRSIYRGGGGGRHF